MPAERDPKLHQGFPPYFVNWSIHALVLCMYRTLTYRTAWQLTAPARRRFASAAGARGRRGIVLVALSLR